MRLSAPNQVLWIIAVVLGVVGALGFFGILAPAAAYAFWLVFAGFVLLVIGTLLTGI